MPNFGVIPVSLKTITVTSSNFTQPSLHSTWCNPITPDLLEFKQLWAKVRFVAEWAMTSECSHCWLPGTKVIRGEAWKSLGIFGTERQWDVRRRGSAWVRGGGLIFSRLKTANSERTSGAEGVGVSVPHVLATETPVKATQLFQIVCLVWDSSCGVHLCLRHTPFGVWKVAGAGRSIPGAVGVSGKAALSAGLPVHAAAVEGHLGDAGVGAHIQLLLWGQGEVGQMWDQMSTTDQSKFRKVVESLWEWHCKKLCFS